MAWFFGNGNANANANANANVMVGNPSMNANGVMTQQQAPATIVGGTTSPIGGFFPIINPPIFKYRYVIYLLLIILFFYMIVEWSNRNSRQYTSHVKQGLNDVVREASRTATLAKQNGNPLLSLIQNSEAVGMMKAIRILASDQDLQHLTGGVPIIETDRELKEQQSVCARSVIHQCREFVSPSRLAELAGYYPNLVNDKTSSSSSPPTPLPPQQQDSTIANTKTSKNSSLKNSFF